MYRVDKPCTTQTEPKVIEGVGLGFVLGVRTYGLEFQGLHSKMSMSEVREIEKRPESHGVEGFTIIETLGPNRGSLSPPGHGFSSKPLRSGT